MIEGRRGDAMRDGQSRMVGGPGQQSCSKAWTGVAVSQRAEAWISVASQPERTLADGVAPAPLCFVGSQAEKRNSRGRRPAYELKADFAPTSLPNSLKSRDLGDRARCDTHLVADALSSRSPPLATIRKCEVLLECICLAQHEREAARLGTRERQVRLMLYRRAGRDCESKKGGAR